MDQPSRRKRRAEADRLATVRRVVEADLDSLEAQLRRLRQDLSGQDIDNDARASLQRAVDAYDTGAAAVKALAVLDDARPVAEALCAGRLAIARERDRVAGIPPRDRPPCFFDPTHGPSVTTVAWTPPPATIPRRVPACESDAARLAGGAQPEVLEVTVGAERVPYWQGGTALAPWVVGYFATYEVLPGLFAGTSIAVALPSSQPLPHKPSDYDGLTPAGGGVDPTGGSNWDSLGPMALG
jgi:hypothetical protein